MEINEAIMALSQSEKIKAGLIWVSQVLGLQQGLSTPDGKTFPRQIQAWRSEGHCDTRQERENRRKKST